MKKAAFVKNKPGGASIEAGLQARSLLYNLFGFGVAFSITSTECRTMTYGSSASASAPSMGSDRQVDSTTAALGPAPKHAQLEGSADMCAASPLMFTQYRALPSSPDKHTYSSYRLGELSSYCV